MNIWFVADLHLNHHNIIGHCKRPFEDVRQMNSVLMDNLNSVVLPQDILYILGDFCWDRRSYVVQEFVQQIKCRKVIFVLGNHDHFLSKNPNDPFISYNKDYVKIVSGFLEVKIENTHVVMCHYPLLSWNKSGHGSINLHGHCHGNLRKRKNALDVGVDPNNYFPLSWERVKQQIAEINSTYLESYYKGDNEENFYD